MKRLALFGAICSMFLLTGMFSAYAQDEHKDEPKKDEARQEERHDEHAEAKHDQRRISDEHFRAHFGREHHFAVGHVTVISGERRFQYGGYWFAFGEPWPAGWAYSDDVYIDFVDGAYYLFNVRHPGVRIVVTVVP